MENEMVVVDSAPMTALNVRAQVNRIQEVMKSVMVENQHYGKIPGAGDKPTLLKAGAEKLMLTFRLAPEVIVEPLFIQDAIGYRVTVNLKTPDGRFVGSGVGECSSLEEKYKWREVVCTEEFEETPVDQRREKWKKGREKPYKVRQVRTNPADQANTILKMAKKRALVDATLTCLAASDIFTQDIEDMDPETLGKGHGSSQASNGSSAEKKESGPGIISEGQRKRLYAISKSLNLSNEQVKSVLDKHGIQSSKDIPVSLYEEIVREIESFGKQGETA